MSAGEDVWSLIATLATALDGDRKAAEYKLDLLEHQLRSMPCDVRNEARRQMVELASALSRLEMRMIESDGPLRRAV